MVSIDFPDYPYGTKDDESSFDVTRLNMNFHITFQAVARFREIIVTQANATHKRDSLNHQW